MSAKPFVLLFSIVCLSTATYAQKGVGKAVGTAVQRQVINRAKLPTLRDGVRNLVMRRLGKIPPSVAVYPASRVVDFKAFLHQPSARAVDLPPMPRRHLDQSDEEFYNVVQPGSGRVAAIALPAQALIKRAAMAESATEEELNVFLRMAEALDQGFAMSQEGNWQFVRGYTLNQFHQLIKHFKDQWPTYSKAYGGQEEPMSQGVSVALDVLDIQAWMLANKGRLAQDQTNGIESAIAWKLDNLMDKAAQDAGFAQDPAVQSAIQHLVHLRATATGGMTPMETIRAVLIRLGNGGRIPGSSLAEVDETEAKLVRELIYVAQLRRANLLYILLPMEQRQSLVDLYLRDFEKRGHLYQQMIKIIPEFAADGKTLNVPSHSPNQWSALLDEWKQARAAAGLSQTPRSAIAGRFGLPVNFNDLTAEEQTEVLLGTYLKVKDK